MDFEDVMEDLKTHEGFSPTAYQDHLGYWTIGYGRLIDTRRGGGISQDEAEMLLKNDVLRTYAHLSARLPGFEDYPEPVRRALMNMAFQMGVNGVLKFKNMVLALDEGDWVMAATEALDSVWAQQTPGRAFEVTQWMKTA